MTDHEAFGMGKRWAADVVKDISKEELLDKAFPGGAPKFLTPMLEEGNEKLMEKLDEAWFELAEAKIYEAKEEEDWAEIMEYIQRRSRNGEELELLQDEVGYGIYNAIKLAGENLIESI